MLKSIGIYSTRIMETDKDWYTQINFWLLLLRGCAIHKMIGVLHRSAGRGSRMIVPLSLKT
ncbi:unnamed protein product [Arabidopsis halleri]